MKFNFFKRQQKVKPVKVHTVKSVKNYEGATAYTLSPEMELYTAVVTSSLSKNFYEKEQDRLKRIVELIKKVDPRFVAKLAVYARTQMHLRSIPLVLAVELAKYHNGDDLVRKTVNGVIQRADEITEILAYYQYANKRNGAKKLNKLSKQFQKGIADAFLKFDEYQFAKYNRQTEVSMKDAMFLVHPKADGEARQELYSKIVKGTLQTPYTWEVELSAVGQQYYQNNFAKQKMIRAKWEELIDSRKLGYMAMMRNLRNMLQANISTTHIEKVADRLSSKEQVLRSRQLPMRYLAAYREVAAIKHSCSAYLMEALEQAVAHSIANIKGFGISKKILLAADVSRSMFAPVSERSKIRCYDIGLLLSMLMRNRSDHVMTGIFGNTWKQVNLPKHNVLANTEKLNSMEGSVGYSTNAFKVIESLNRSKVQYDKLMIFSDLQVWDSTAGGNSLRKEWLRYKRNVAPKAKLYLFDLLGHGNTPLKTTDNDVYLVAGWSEKVFDMMHAIEKRTTAIEVINKIKL